MLLGWERPRRQLLLLHQDATRGLLLLMLLVVLHVLHVLVVLLLVLLLLLGRQVWIHLLVLVRVHGLHCRGLVRRRHGPVLVLVRLLVLVLRERGLVLALLLLRYGLRRRLRLLHRTGSPRRAAPRAEESGRRETGQGGRRRESGRPRYDSGSEDGTSDEVSKDAKRRQ